MYKRQYQKMGRVMSVRSLRSDCLGTLMILFCMSIFSNAAHCDDPVYSVVLELPLENPITGSPETAIKACTAALEQSDLDERTRVKCYNLRAQAYYALDDLELADSDSLEVIRLSPGHQESRCRRAQILHRRGDVKTALEQFEALAQEDETIVLAHAGIAFCRIDMDDGPRALAAANRAVELDPASPAALMARSWVYYSLGDMPKCIDDATKVILIRPWNELAYVLKGTALKRLGRYEEAITSLLMAKHFAPTDYETTGMLYECCQRSKKYQASLYWAEEMVRLDGTRGDAYEAVATARRFLGEPEKAWEVLQEGLKNAVSNKSRLFAAAASSLSDRGEYELAAQYYDEALVIDDNLYSALMGKAYLLAGCPDDAIRNGPQARQIAKRLCDASGWKEPGFLFLYAAASSECGDFEKAIEVVTQALELLPDSATLLRAGYRQWLKSFEEGTPYRQKPLSERHN